VSAVRTLASQAQLRQTRNDFRALVAQMQTDNFPRSATMKFLMSATGHKAIAFLLGGTSLRAAGVAPRVGRLLRSLVVGVLMKRIWTRMRK